MVKVKDILIRLLIVFILCLFVDKGKTILLICNNIQANLIHNQASNPEISPQQNQNKSNDDETWVYSNSFELSCSSEEAFLISLLSG